MSQSLKSLKERRQVTIFASASLLRRTPIKYLTPVPVPPVTSVSKTGSSFRFLDLSILPMSPKYGRLTDSVLAFERSVDEFYWLSELERTIVLIKARPLPVA